MTLANIAKQISICDRKIHYASRGAAMIRADRLGHNNKPYQCPICGEWHLTSQGLG